MGDIRGEKERKQGIEKEEEMLEEDKTQEIRLCPLLSKSCTIPSTFSYIWLGKSLGKGNLILN